MATVSAIAANLFETIGLVQPSIEVMVRDPKEHSEGQAPLRMRWIRDVDAHGRRVIRIQWMEEKSREEEPLYKAK